MRIGILAARAGVSVRALRYYEEQGLISAERTSGGHREYVESDVARVLFIQRLLAARLPSRTIVDLLPFLDTGAATPAMVDRLAEEHAKIERRIHELSDARDRLATLREVAAESVAGQPPSACMPGIAAATAV